MSRKRLPEINAGSMADIAFLLLIFFLVTTTMDIDAGILRKLPEKQDIKREIDINERNILEVNLNRNNELLVENKIIPLEKLQQITIDFIDNGGGLDKDKKTCDWCNGKKLASLSDHPTKAFISIQADRKTNYETYIKTLDKLNSAYTILRDRLALEMYKTSYTELVKAYQKSKSSDNYLKQRITTIRSKYPHLISDAEIKN